MSDFKFYVNIYASSNTASPLGVGPIESVSDWRYTARDSQAGEFTMEMAANDPMAAYLRNRRVVRAFALLENGWGQVGNGIIESIETIPGTDGRARLRVSGPNLMGELKYINMGQRQIGADGDYGLANSILTLQDAAPEWNFTANVAISDYIVAKFDGESVLGAALYIAEKTQMHLTMTTPVIPEKTMVFWGTYLDSGVRAIRARGDLPTGACAITSLTQTIDTHDLLTRIYPFGAGDDHETSLTLSATTRSAPVGYTLNKTDNYIQNDTAVTLYGLVDYPYIEFKEIVPLSGTNADYEAASDMLFEAALLELERRSNLDEQTTYALTIAQCNQLLAPVETMRLVYRDPEQNIDVDADLYILEVTWQMDTRGIRTTGLVVSTHPYWPKRVGDNAAGRVIQSKIYQTHQQISLNEWWSHKEMLIGSDQTDHMGTFPWVMGASVVTIKEVLFRFKVEGILTGAYTYAYAGGATSVVISAAADTGDTTVTIDLNSAGSTNAASAGTSDLNSAGSTNSASAGTSDLNSAGSTNSASAGTSDLNSAGSTNSAFAGTTDDNTAPLVTGNNSAPGDPHTHTIAAHSHASTTFSHSHVMPQHTHGFTTTHAHVLPQHTHGFTTTHAHVLPQHTHGFTATHAHVIPQHTHTNTAHHHSSPQHVHGLPALTPTFGLQRVAPAGTYAIGNLEYSVNGGAWVSLDTATAVPSATGWYQLDITEDVTDPLIPFRPVQTSGHNAVEIRCKTAVAGTGKSALIQAMLGVRTTIQGVSVA